MKPCQQCGTEMPDDAPEGLCPRCLISAAVKPGDISSEPTRLVPEPGAVAAGGSGASGSPIPDIGDPAEVARRLPQFEILSLLGRGGMGVVYKARQLNLDRIVALKILPPGDAMSPDFIERFRREARSLAKLSHPNIVAVHDFGESGGLYYFAMEFVDGVNLREMIRTGKMKPEEALAVVPKICDALQFAHEEGVVHRDVKPENILIDKRGRVKIADFGLAKLLRREHADHTLTMTGMTLGTPRYMAPEQLDKPETVDHRADIYSLGVVFYEMLTGEVPMGRFAPPSEKVRIDVRLDEIVLHALERDADRRYQHVSQVRDDVEKVSSSPKVAQASPPVGPAGILPAFPGTPGGTPAGPTDWKSVPQPPAATRFLRSLLLLAVVAGVVMFIWFEKATYFPEPGVGESTIRIGAVQPWLVIGDRLTSYAPNFLTVSGLAGIGALIALIALFCFRPPKPAKVAEPAPSTPQLLARINARGIEMMIAGLALALSGLIGFIYGIVTAANYAATVTNPADNVATRAATGALLFIPFFLCGIAAFVSSLGMRKLRFHPFALVMSILLVLALPASVIVNHAPPPQLILFQVAYAFYAGLRAFLLLRRPETEAAFAVAPRTGPSGNPPTGMLPLLMIFAGVLTVLSAILTALLVTGVFVDRSAFDAFFRQDSVTITLLVMQTLALPCGVTMILAGLNAATSPGFARTAAKLACVPLTPAWLFTMPLGIYALNHLPRTASEMKPASVEPRLSRCAITGAVWAVLGLLATASPLIEIIFAAREGMNFGPVLIPLLVLASVITIFGTTILGAVAVAQIKRSGGKLYGLRLAAADALFFPLLAVGSLAFYLTNLIAFTVAFNLRTPPVPVPGAPPEGEPFAVIDFAVLDSLVALTVMFFAGRAAWRSISGYQKPSVPSAGAVSGRNHWVRIPLGLAGLALLWLALREIIGALVTLVASDSMPVEVLDTIAETLAAFICLMTLLLGWRALFCWESENREGQQPFVWRSLLFVAGFGMIGLSVMGARALHRDETALRHATERADAVVTKTASGTVLRFEAAGRTVDLPVAGSGMGWGAKVRLCYPPGQPEAARSLGNIQAGRFRNSVFMVVGMLPALVFVIRAARRKTAATKADSSGK